MAFDKPMTSTNELGEPSTPRPHEDVILAVLPDIATILSASALDSAGLRQAAIDEITSQLQAMGHNQAAIEWAMHKGVTNAWLSHATCKRDRKTSNPRTGVTQARPNIVELPAIVAHDAFWQAWMSTQFSTTAHFFLH